MQIGSLLSRLANDSVGSAHLFQLRCCRNSSCWQRQASAKVCRGVCLPARTMAAGTKSETAFSLDDEAFSSDEFRMYYFKVRSLGCDG